MNTSSSTGTMKKINEIEFTEDAVIEEYQFKDKPLAFYCETIFGF